MVDTPAVHDHYELPPDLPVPDDDGACDHLPGMEMPHVVLRSTASRDVDVSEASKTESVFFFYPATGKPGVLPPRNWNQTPGARGCTPESCSYRDLNNEFQNLDFRVFGVSSQRPQVQTEFAARNRIPYEILSDSELLLSGKLGLPTFSVEPSDPIFPKVCIKRLTLVVSEGRIERVFYPVFPPDKNAVAVLSYLTSR